MPSTAAGLISSLGLATESTVGTYVTPDHFYEFTTESLKFVQKRIESKAIRNGRRIQARWALGVADGAGDFDLELPNRGLAFLLKHIFGSSTLGTTVARSLADGVTNTDTGLVSATATFVAGDVGATVSGPGIPVGTTIVTRTNATTVVLSAATTATATGVAFTIGNTVRFTPGDTTGLSFTTQVPRPDITGTKRIFSQLGCKVDKWTLSAKVNEYGMLKITPYFMSEDRAQSLASPSYGAGYSPLVFTSANLLVAGTEVAVTEFSLQGDNSIAKGRHYMRATTPTLPKEALENGIRPITGNFKADFESLTLYNNYINGAEAALVINFWQSATSALVLTMNARFDGDTPVVADEKLLTFTQPFVVVSGTSDAAAISALVGTSETAL